MNDHATIVTTLVVDAEPDWACPTPAVEYAAERAMDEAYEALAESDRVTDADITITHVDEPRQRATLRVSITVDNLDAALHEAVLTPEDSFLLPCEYIAEHSNVGIHDATA